MRKITSILLLAWLALAGIMNAQSLPFTPATISDGKFNQGTQYYYIIISEKTPSRYLYIDGDDVKWTTTKGNADQFAITGNTGDGFKIYKKGDTNNLIYLTSTTSNSVDNVSYGNSNTYNTWTFYDNGGGKYSFYQIGPCSTKPSEKCTLNSHENETSLWTWTDNTAPGRADCNITFEVGDVEADALINLTYRFNLNGVISSKVVSAAVDGNFPELGLPAFCQGTKPEGIVSAGDEGTIKDINVTWNGPFNYSSTVEDAEWYLMTLAKADNGNLPVVRYNPSNQYITLEQGDNTFTYAKNDQWAFVGNPFDGFKIYNRALSGGRLISSTTMNGETGKSTFPYVSADALSSGYTDTWDVYEQGVGGGQSAIPGGFAISQHGTPANKINRRDSRMAYWTTGSDNGSTFTVSQTSLPDITLNPVNGTSYASFYVDYPVVVTTDNVKVYTGTVNNNSLEMTEAGDKIIPANVGVVLISETGGTTAEISISNENGTLLSGDLTGTTTGQNIAGSQSNYLVLGRDASDETKVGFYRPSGTQIPANKAYIYLAGGSVQGLAFNFDGATTDINSISAATNKQEIYDLSGRRVMKANKGLYIINGKKCFIK
ncbi:MAG: hypothetical protein ACI3X8_01570 [Alloprevotella sp.]